ncbi:MAG: DinB family protein [Anaerolineales bacterium]|nr:DinB family protein [Anaerolineales bacterium]
MTLTLLLDLDDTLLGNQMDTFIPAYMGALGKYLSEHVHFGEMSQTMMAATQKMFANNEFDQTLKEVFDRAFYAPLGLEEAQIKGDIDAFYERVFPNLRTVTQARPEAVAMVDEAVRRGYRVGVATNPLFPLTAIRQRLEWAGFRPDAQPFALIPSYESFHFAKPNPAYFAEFMARLGWPRGPVLMVGNDYDHDVRGAHAMGIQTFWIANGMGRPESGPEPVAWGELGQLMEWLENTTIEQLQPDYSSPGAIMATLRGVPASLDEIIAKLPEHQWHHHPAPGEWNLTQICCHLRDVEQEVNLPRLQKLSQDQHPFILGVDTDAWAEQHDYASQDGPQALADFFAARKDSLQLLEQLDAHGWQSPARHAIFGPTTLRELVSFIASHDRLHLRQIFATLDIK